MASKKAKKSKKPYVPSPWSYIKPKEDERRKLTLFVAGAVPPSLDTRLDKLTANYEVVTVMCAETGSEQTEEPRMEDVIKDWAHKRRQRYNIIPQKDLNEFAGWMQFMQPDGNKAVITYDDESNKEDIKFAESLGKEEDVQYKSIKIVEPCVQKEAEDFAKAVNSILQTSNNNLTR